MAEDHSEEQDEEIEVLGSIFPEELQIIDATGEGDSLKSFRILIQPFPDGSDEKSHVSIYLKVEFPKEYPETATPILAVEIKKGLSGAQVDELSSLAEQTAADNVGLPSIYTIVEALKEWLADHNIEGQDGSMYSEMLRKTQQKELEQKKQSHQAQQIAAAEREFSKYSADGSSAGEEQVDEEELERIRKRQAGTNVTVESFLQWKVAFAAEMKALAAAAGRGKDDGAGAAAGGEERLTGKQFFLQAAAAGNAAGDEEGVDDAEGEGEEYVYAEGEEEDSEDDEDDEDFVEGEGEEEDGAEAGPSSIVTRGSAKKAADGAQGVVAGGSSGKSVPSAVKGSSSKKSGVGSAKGSKVKS